MADVCYVNTPWKVLLFAPNIIGYFRIVLSLLAIICYDYPVHFVLFYSCSCFLDFVDGKIARSKKQVSDFGAWLDVAVDIFLRSFLWTALFPKLGSLVSCLEWLCFVCTHSLGSKWKSYNIKQPLLVQLIMQKGFKTFMGAYVMGGIWGLPLWMYINRGFPGMHFNETFIYCVTYLLTLGRFLGAFCEVWYIYDHILTLLMQSVECEEDKVD